MIGTDKDALLCDLAETYGVFDFYTLPVTTIATLAVGLRESSRIKHKINNLNEIPPEYTLVHIADALTVLLKGLSGEKDKTPELYSDLMAGKSKKTANKGFNSIEEFEAARKRFING